VIAVIGRSRVIETASLTADWRGWSRIRKRPNLHHGDTETRRKTGKRFTTDQHWWQWSGKDQVIAVIARDRGWEKDRNSPRRRGGAENSREEGYRWSTLMTLIRRRSGIAR